MKPSILFTLAVLAAGGGAGAAGAYSPDAAGRTTTICLDSGGRQLAVHCHQVGGGSRLETRDDVCVCPSASRMVTAPVCDPGTHPPSESAAYEQARLKAVSHGSVAGASFQGQAMCVAPHERGGR